MDFIAAERHIADRIAKANGLTIAKLGLRFDKVAVRLLGNIGVPLKKSVPRGQTVLMTITAPIRLPAKTESEILMRIGDFLKSGGPQQDQRLSIFGNEVCLRIIKTASKRADKFLGMVHNPATGAKQLLDLATQWIREG